MKLGQIPENVYKRSVMKEIELKKGNIKGGVVSKETYAFFGDSDTTFSEAKNATLKEADGTMAIYSAVNVLLASGALPKAVNINMLMPHRYAEEKLKYVIERLGKAALLMDVDIATFNGEMLNALIEPVISVDAIGNKNSIELNRNAAKRLRLAKDKEGKFIVLTKWVGMAGTCIIAENKYDELVNRFSASYVEGMLELKNYLSIKEEAEAINEIRQKVEEESGILISQEVSKGGIYKALWDIGELCSSGLEVDLKSIPIKQETVEVCNYYDINPYEMYSEGCMLIICEDGDALAESLINKNIPATVIGRLKADNDRVIINDYERKFLTKPKADGLTEII